MSAVVKWLPEASQDLGRLQAFLRDKDPAAADRALATIEEKVSLLSEWPMRGRPVGDEREMRDLFVAFGAGAYVVRYRIVAEEVVVVRVWRDRENRPH